jgi:enoyl-CoA hydratase/carnithine racemase
VLHTSRDGSVLTAALDTPPANALGAEELSDLTELVRQLSADAGDVRVLVLRGSPRFFSGGVNIAMIAETADRPGGTDLVADFGAELQGVLNELEALPIPTIAAMRGSAVGGGLELALACDFRIVGADSSYGLPESHLGLIPGAGGTQRLTEVAGRGTALRLILLGELVKGDEAMQLGIAQWVRANDEVDDFALELAHKLSKLAPNALTAAKQCITAARTRSGFDLEISSTRALLTQADTTHRLGNFLAGIRKR